jgi:hypothetical protein
MSSPDDTLILQLPVILLPRGACFATPLMDLHATDFTIATKLNLASTASRNVILANWSANQSSWQLLFAVNGGGRPSIALRKDLPTAGSDPDQDLLILEASSAVPAGSWHHVAATFTWGADYTHPVCTLYVDGAAAGRAAPSVAPSPKLRNPYTLMPSKNAYLVGRKEDSADDGSWFSGQMSDLRVYRSALSADAVAQLAR